MKFAKKVPVPKELTSIRYGMWSDENDWKLDADYNALPQLVKDRIDELLSGVDNDTWDWVDLTVDGQRWLVARLWIEKHHIEIVAAKICFGEEIDRPDF